MDPIKAYPIVFVLTVILPMAGGFVGAYLGYDALKSRYEDDVHKTEISAKLEKISNQIAPAATLLPVIQQYAKSLEQANEKDAVLSAVLVQYTHMKQATEKLNRIRHAPSNEAEELAKHILATIQSDIYPIRVAEEIPSRPLIIKIAANTFRVLFAVPTRIPPKLEFTGLPLGAAPTVIENSKFGFTVIFSPQSTSVESFGFIGDARI